MLAPLPPPLGRVTVPSFVSPSALGSVAGCRLRLFASSREWDVPRLVAGPAAAIGILAHRVRERALEGGDGGGSYDTRAALLFDETYAELRAELAEDPRRAHFADLESTVTAVEWLQRRASIIAKAGRILEAAGPFPAPRRSAGRQGSAPSVMAIPIGGARSEFPLASERLRLRGSADVVRRVAEHEYEVCDYKTGVVLDAEGRIKQEVTSQLRAYGLLICEADPMAKVSLVVDDGEERAVDFGDVEREGAREALERALGGIDPETEVEATEIASPGTSCWGCGIRHVCPSYRAEAPFWWLRVPDGLERIPRDTWGEIVAVQGSETRDVSVRDEAGRRRRIDRLDPRMGVTADLVGFEAAFFSLETDSRGLGINGRLFHPRSFHELPRDRHERRAWSLEVYSPH